MTNNKQPEIRFPEFPEDWEQRELGEVVKITMGQSPSGKNYTENPTDHILVQGNADMKKGKVIPRVWTTQITKTAEPNDIILSVRAPVGDIGKTDYNVVLGRGVAGIKGNDFVYQTLVKMKETGFWTRYSTGSTFESINSTDLKEAVISIPNEKEQQKVGEFFKQLDETIALHQQELTTLKETKQSFLQKMFPKEGEQVPEIRFPGFNDDWEQHKVESMSEKTYGGGTPKTQIDEYWQGDFPWIQSSDLKIDELNNVNPQKFITEEAIKNSATKAIPEKSIAIVTRVGVGKLAYLNYSYSTSQDFLSLSKLTVDPFFGMYGLYRLIKKELNNIQGTSIKGMTKSDLLDKKLYIPNITEEQQKIGAFFKTLDDTIALHQRELDLLKETKKAFLQKMFV